MNVTDVPHLPLCCTAIPRIAAPQDESEPFCAYGWRQRLHRQSSGVPKWDGWDARQRWHRSLCRRRQRVVDVLARGNNMVAIAIYRIVVQQKLVHWQPSQVDCVRLLMMMLQNKNAAWKWRRRRRRRRRWRRDWRTHFTCVRCMPFDTVQARR